MSNDPATLDTVVDAHAVNPMKERVRRFVALEKQRRDLEDQLALVKGEIGALQDQIIEDFNESGTQTERVDGMTVYLHYQTWARPKDGDKQRLAQALSTSGDPQLRGLIEQTVNTHSLSAVVRERLKEAAEQDRPDESILPPVVFDAISLSTDCSVRTRKAATPKRVVVGASTPDPEIDW